MLTVSQFYYPGFRHNDLKPDNILVDVYPKEENTYYCYNIFNKKYTYQILVRELNYGTLVLKATIQLKIQKLMILICPVWVRKRSQSHI